MPGLEARSTWVTPRAPGGGWPGRGARSRADPSVRRRPTPAGAVARSTASSSNWARPGRSTDRAANGSGANAASGGAAVTCEAARRRRGRAASRRRHRARPVGPSPGGGRPWRARRLSSAAVRSPRSASGGHARGARQDEAVDLGRVALRSRRAAIQASTTDIEDRSEPFVHRGSGRISRRCQGTVRAEQMPAGHLAGVVTCCESGLLPHVVHVEVRSGSSGCGRRRPRGASDARPGADASIGEGVPGRLGLPEGGVAQTISAARTGAWTTTWLER